MLTLSSFHQELDLFLCELLILMLTLTRLTVIILLADELECSLDYMQKVSIKIKIFPRYRGNDLAHTSDITKL